MGAVPQFWMHLVALYLAVVLAWFRGVHIGKPWLPIFPFLAGIFDLMPGLNWIFLIPTVFHILALVLGVAGSAVVSDYAASKRRVAVSVAGLVAVVALAVFKTQAFFDNANTRSRVPSAGAPKASAPAVTHAAPQVPQSTQTPFASQLRSREGSRATSVRFINATSQPVHVYWIDYQGREQLYRTLTPGEGYDQPTFVTHPWVVKEGPGGALLATVVGEERPQVANVRGR